MSGRLRQLLEPRLRQQAETEKSQTPVERDIHVQWVRKTFPSHTQNVSQKSRDSLITDRFSDNFTSDIVPQTISHVLNVPQ